MLVPVQITFRDMPVSDAIEAHCWAEATKLRPFLPNISTCCVVVSGGHRHRPERLSVRIDLVRSGAIEVVREPGARATDLAARAAISDAFEETRRCLEANGDARRVDP